MSNPNGAELIENSLENIGGNLWPAHRPADATEPVPLLGNRHYDFFQQRDWVEIFCLAQKPLKAEGVQKNVQKSSGKPLLQRKS